MLLQNGGINWRAAKAQLPMGRVLRSNLTRTRILPLVAIFFFLVLLCRSIFGAAPIPQVYALIPS